MYIFIVFIRIVYQQYSISILSIDLYNYNRNELLENNVNNTQIARSKYIVHRYTVYKSICITLYYD